MLENLRNSFRRGLDPRHRGEDEGMEWSSWDDNWTRVVRPLVVPNIRVAG